MPGTRLTDDDTLQLLMSDVPLRLATIRRDGLPRITPLWFLYEDGAFHMTSVAGHPHLRDLARDPGASVCVDVEERVTEAGTRRNRRVKAYGRAQVRPDEGGAWTRRITRKYIRGAEGEDAAERRASVPRMLIILRSNVLLTGSGP